MCDQPGCELVPLGTVRFEVKFCGYSQSWSAFCHVDVLTDGGDIIELGCQRRDFGPFDSYTDVQHWLASAGSVLRRIPDQTLKVWTPAGGDLPPVD